MPESPGLDSSSLMPMTNKQFDKASKLIEMRRNRKPVDLLRMLEAFPTPVRKYLLRGMQHIQFADGCTGGCSWCGFDVNRKITKGFDFESLEEFSKRYARELPDRVCLFWASDPLDISGRRRDGAVYDYDDIVGAMIPHLRKGQKIYTATKLPEGTETTAIKLLQRLHEVWKEDFLTHGDNYMHTVRFSVTEANSTTRSNKEIIQSIKSKLYELGLEPNYIEAQFWTTVERNDETIKKLGKFIKHPDRKILSDDSVTVACYDGVLTTPDGLFTIYMDMATKDNPYGYGLRELNPKDTIQEIPKYLRVNNYFAPEVAKKILRGSEDLIIPQVEFEHIDTSSGRLIETITLPSMRRDGLTFFYALAALNLLPAEALSPQAKKSLEHMKVELEKRYIQAKSLSAIKTDEEAKSVIDPLWNEINNRINTLLDHGNDPGK